MERERPHGKACNIRTKIIRTTNYEGVVIEAVNQFNQTEVVFRDAKYCGCGNLQKCGQKGGQGSEGGGPGPAGGATWGRVPGVAAALRGRRARKGDDTEIQAQIGDDRSYDYVEVMACPAGCVNGGGQARRPAKPEESGDVANLVNGDTAGMGSRWGHRDASRPSSRHTGMSTKTILYWNR
ncbi:hypothetical protein PIIN_09487 [Serendipita indica DSM 11827]|uniref:Iron hydrogenase large subunit C-terminal domain-containing protein n=1 Tax=Serendipita indica (strain DSM 11827) TaxID=1109443 RepID=G4TW11_SERID|nr:hypothetical protein PIIN_09487 [Serendipita indica DSM 11827]